MLFSFNLIESFPLYIIGVAARIFLVYLNNLASRQNFAIFQNLILGILIHKFDPSSLYQKTENSYVYKDDKFNLNSKVIQSTVSISPFNSRVLKHSFKDQNNFFEVSYDDYTIVDEQILPTKIRFSNNGLESLYIEIKSISSLEKINIPFRIPKNYKRIKL